MINGNNSNICVAILAGGSGTRLWPLSTAVRPKPFVPLGTLGTLYEETVSRACALRPLRIFTVGAHPLRGLCAAPAVQFLEEPGARNTAAAIALAGAMAWRESGDGGRLLILPADHHIPDVDAFCRTIGQLDRAAVAEAALGVMGIAPTGPEVSYGYIEQGIAAGDGFRVARFIEKPDRAKAEDLLARGNVVWNSGMFLYPLGVLRSEMEVHTPGLWAAAEAWLDHGDAAPYLALPSVSVDYALMEKTARVIMVPARYKWSDVGTFSALHDLLPKDGSGNSGWGSGHAEGCSDCLLVSDHPKALIRNLTGMAVIQSGGALLVTPLKGSEGIRSGVEAVLRKSK